MLVVARVGILLSSRAEAEVPLEERNVVLLARVIVALEDRGHISNGERRGRRAGRRVRAALGILGIGTACVVA